MVAAAEAAEAEPVAWPSGLCGQRPDAAQSQDGSYTDAMEEVCTIQIFVANVMYSEPELLSL